MKVSLLMATYNGSKYISEQLVSILRQSRQPDEVLIFDDCSTDNTVSIMNEFIKDNNLTNWKVTVNEVNKGWQKNFIDGLKSITGDIVFLCDQDDIWNLDKIEVMEIQMKRNNKISLLASNYSFIHQDTLYKIKSVFQRRFKNTGKVIRYEFTPSLLHGWPGCTMCIKKDFIDSVIEGWNEGLAHDLFLFYNAAWKDALYVFDYPTICYRRHSSNATKGKGNINARIQISQNRIRLIKSLISAEKNINNHTYKMKICCKALKFHKLRIELFRTRNIIYWIHLVLYLQYYKSFRDYALKGYIADLYSILFRKSC